MTTKLFHHIVNIIYGAHIGLTFLNAPNNISNAAITTVSGLRECLRVTPLRTDTKPLFYNTTFYKIHNKQENSNASLYLTIQNIQTPSHFTNDELVEILTTTTKQSCSEE